MSKPPRRVASAILLAMLWVAESAGFAESATAIRLPQPLPRPCVACSPAELERLRAGHNGQDAAKRQAVAALFAAKRQAADAPVGFPERGGQHGQWYQCDDCEIGLRRDKDGRHRCPGCNRIFSGRPYDDVIFGNRHREILRLLLARAWEYAITGNEAAARGAADILLGYAERYRNYPYQSNARSNPAWHLISGGRLFSQTLEEAVAITNEIAPAYDLIYTWPGLDAAAHRRIREELFLPMLENISKYNAGRNNWQSWHNAAYAAAGAVLAEPQWLEKAIHDPDGGFLFQMQNSICADGMWYEGGWGYHSYALQALVATAETARHIGIDLWGNERFRRTFSLPAEYRMPDGSLPRFGDAVGARPASFGRFCESAWHATQDPRLLPLLPARPSALSVMYGRDPAAAASATPPALQSRLFSSAGHAILRAPGPAVLAAALRFGDYGGNHDHFDKLSFVFFAHGAELGVDPGRAADQAYRLPVHKHWYRATVGHNAVVVDGASQEPAGGICLFFAEQAGITAAAFSCDTAYEGVSQRRLLLLTPRYLLVHDELAGSKEHVWDFVYHNRGERAESASPGEPLAELPRYGDSAKYLQNLRQGLSANGAEVRFVGKKISTRLLLAAVPGAPVTVITGNGPGSSVKNTVPLVIFSRQGRRATFTAVLEPVPENAAPLVAGVAAEPTADGNWRLRVRGTDGGEEGFELRGWKELLPVGSDSRSLRPE